LQAAVASSVYLGLYHSAFANVANRFRELPCEIVEIETLRLTLFIKRDHQISNGLSFQSISLGVAKLFPLCFTLRLPSPLLLPYPLFVKIVREVPAIWIYFIASSLR